MPRRHTSVYTLGPGSTSFVGAVADAAGLSCGAGGPPGGTYVLQCDEMWCSVVKCGVV